MTNKCIFLGNIGRKPEVKELANGSKYVQFSIACNEGGYKKADGTEVPERTEWVSCVAWRGTAEYMGKYVEKGDRLLVEGKLRTRSYEDEQGIKRYISEIVVDSIEHMRKNGSSIPAPEEPEAAKPASEQPATPVDEDDLPF